MSTALNEIANRIVRSGIDDVTASPLYDAFRLMFVRTYGREPGQRGAVHELYSLTDAPDTF